MSRRHVRNPTPAPGHEIQKSGDKEKGEDMTNDEEKTKFRLHRNYLDWFTCFMVVIFPLMMGVFTIMAVQQGQASRWVMYPMPFLMGVLGLAHLRHVRRMYHYEVKRALKHYQTLPRNMELEKLKVQAVRYFEHVWCPAEEPKNSDSYRAALYTAALGYARTVSNKEVEVK